MLRPVVGRIQPALISHENMARILGICRHMPGTLSARVGFECPLGSPEPRADLLVLIRGEGSERETLAGQNLAYPFAPAGGGASTWGRIQSLAAGWLSPGSALERTMSNMWLEFDVDDGSDSELPTEPNVFIGPTEGIDGGSSFGPWLTEDALPVLLGARLSPRARATIEKCVAEQPPGTSVTHVGAMLQRPSSALRLVVSYIKAEDIVPYLARIGWRGSLAAVGAVIQRHFQLPDVLLLDLDVGEEVAVRIGIEGMFSTPYFREPRWPVWLAELERDGLCLPEKRRALAAFNGWMDEVNHRDVWPDALLRASAVLNRRSLSTIFLSLHHIKVVYEPQRPLRAKGYIGAGTQWVRSTANGVSSLEGGTT